MDTCTLLEKIAKLKQINENNSKNLLKLGIDMSALPSNIGTTVKNFVDTQNVTGIHDLDLINLELWHSNKKNEVLNLQQDVLKPLRRKVKNVNSEIEQVQKKVIALDESIDDFKSVMIADEEFHNKTREIGLVIAEAEKAITETPLPPIELDCDNLINQVNSINAERKLKCKNNPKKY